MSPLKGNWRLHKSLCVAQGLTRQESALQLCSASSFHGLQVMTVTESVTGTTWHGTVPIGSRVVSYYGHASNTLTIEVWKPPITTRWTLTRLGMTIWWSRRKSAVTSFLRSLKRLWNIR